ncbi:hypothetical protein LOD99_7911 [Oopsacas minuta]|uniref:Alanyl-transfer RNA synthetases family profile domain-containing protein n=1 Tax=Oopsacas minuta TaxID=111878 RepID=A0AAV7JJV5_9METZ|nr:hypothetical protein LOD99_7911 [Oopsacas minuta]
MAFECQRNSYKCEFDSKVLSCKISDNKPGLYRIVFDDTILFPEGGGQPEDLGCLNDSISVLHVEREGDVAVHYTKVPLEEGEHVHMRVNWERRWDHMQQHSGQHLITAVIERKTGYKTISWCLGVGLDNKCFIELDSNKMSLQQLQDAEEECNKLIIQSRAVNVRIIERDSEEFNLVRSRGLPSGSVGPIRVVDMQGVDVNMCCGTHVSNLSHLQCIKLLHMEQKGTSSTLVHFVVGGRVCHQLGRMHANERSLSKLLSCGPEEYGRQIEKISKNQRADAKQNKIYLREIAELTVKNHLSSPCAVESYFVLHRDDADHEFMSVICNMLLPHKILILLTGGGRKGQGIFLLSGKDDKLVSELGPQISAMLEGKGGGRGSRYQGKVQKIELYKVAFEFVKNHLCTQ